MPGVSSAVFALISSSRLMSFPEKMSRVANRLSMSGPRSRWISLSSLRGCVSSVIGGVECFLKPVFQTQGREAEYLLAAHRQTKRRQKAAVNEILRTG